MMRKNGVSTVIVAGGLGTITMYYYSLVTVVVVADSRETTLNSVETLVLASHEDLATATSRQVGSLPAARSHFPLVNIGDRLFILGGWNEDWDIEDTVLISDDGGERWDLLPDRMKMAREGHTAVSTETLC